MNQMRTLLFLFTFYSCCLFAQNKLWNFGGRCGLDFTSGSPVVTTTSMMQADEGCVTITNNANQLLFYSNGDTVWNANNVPMSNGTGLNGQLSSSQSCLAIRKPGSTTLWYLFTTAAQGNAAGLCYSEIDMSLNAGMGDVTSNKNVQLVTPCCEKLAAVRHANGIDIWVVVHPLNSGSFYAYLVTAAGISTPVNSLVGGTISSTANNDATIGCMKFSCDGTKLGVAPWGLGEIQLYDFNKATGAVSNYQFLDIPYRPYGVEFSATGHYLYVTAEYNLLHYIFQYDVTAANVPGSEILIDTIQYIQKAVYGLQLGPDHKIYGARLFGDSLAVINNPDLPGTACGFVLNGLYLGGRTSYYGLPNFLPAGYCIPSNPDAVEEESSNNLISVYPNPAGDVVHIDPPALTDEVHITVTNPLGQIVYECYYTRPDAIEIVTECYTPGIYLVTIRTESISLSKPFVVDR